jgi:hypothetical protein
VFAARRAGLTKNDVLNTLPLEAFREHRRSAPGSGPAKPSATNAAAVKKQAAPTAGKPARPASRKALKKVAKKADRPATSKRTRSR